MESMEKHVRSLTSILEEEHALYRDVFELIKNEQSVLVNADIEKLEKNLLKQQKLTAKIHKLEKKRLRELEVIGIYLGALPAELKIATIAQNVAPDLAERLTKLERHFRIILQEILKLNKANKFLIDRSLLFIEEHVQVFFGAIEDKGLYHSGKSGKARLKNNAIIDWKA